MIRYHFVFRNTIEGHATFAPAGVDAAEVNDADDVTFQIINGSPSFPTAGSGYITNYGRLGTGGTSTDLTLTNAGGSGHTWRANLAGSSTWSSGTQCFQIQVNANGDYDVWIASGGATDGTADNWVLWDDSYANITAGTASYNAIGGINAIREWLNSTAYTTSNFIVAPDGGVWVCTTAGTTDGTGNPSGGVKNDTYSSGTAVFTHTGRFALAWGFTTVGGTNIAYHNSDGPGEIAVASWPGVAKTVTVANGYLTLTRGTAASRIRSISVLKVGVPLVDAIMYDQYGTIDSTPTVYAQQVSGYRAARVAFSAGVTNDISLTGALSSYFTLESVGDGSYYITHNGTPIPDALAGSRVLNVVQTDAEASGSPYTTVFNFNVVSSGGRTNTDDGTVEGAICTQSWMNLNYIRNVHTTWLWEGCANEIFDTDVAVDNYAGLLIAIADAATASTGTSFHRIRLQEGGTGFVGGYDTLEYDFGDGGLIIEPDTGHDPIYCGQFYPMNICGIHFNNLHISTDPSNLEARTFRGDNPGATGINGGGRSLKIAVTNCRIGVGHRLTLDNNDDQYILGNTSPVVTAESQTFLTTLHGESVYIADNFFDGSDEAPLLNLSGVRAVKIENNLVIRNGADFVAGMGLSEPDTVMNGFFSDNSSHFIICNNVQIREPAYAGYSSLAHADGWQGRTPARNSSFWYANSGENNSIGNPWEVNDTCYRQSEQKWYKVVSITTGLTGATGPTGTGTGIVDGGVTWDYLADNSAIGVPLYLAMYGNVMVSCNNVTPDSFDRQWYIDSNDGFDMTPTSSIFDNVSLGTSDKGISFTEGYLWAEYNTFGGVPEFHPDATYNPASISVNVNDNDLYTEAVLRKNVVMKPINSGTIALVYEQDTVDLEWDVSDAVSQTPPGDYLNGPFGTTTYNTTDSVYIPTSVMNSGSMSRAAINSQVRRAFANQVNDSGIWSIPYDAPIIYRSLSELISQSLLKYMTLANITSTNSLNTDVMKVASDYIGASQNNFNMAVHLTANTFILAEGGTARSDMNSAVYEACRLFLTNRGVSIPNSFNARLTAALNEYLYG